MSRDGLVFLLLVGGCTAPDKLAPIDLEAADGPSPDEFSSELDLLDRYDDEIEGRWLALEEGSFEGGDGVTVRYRSVSPADPKGTVVWLGGRTEAAMKHAENAFDLEAHGYAVTVMDHRGHGASDRMLDNPDVCHVDWFQDYVDDLGILVDSELAGREGPLFLVAHSMGAAVGALFLWERPEVFDGAVFSSPMFGIDTGAFPQGVAQTLGNGVCGASAGEGYTIGHGDYEGSDPFEESTVTQSEVRFDLKLALYENHPELRLGGASWRWVCESMWAAQHLERLGRHTPTRTLVLKAGDERIVLPESEDAWCDDAPGCQLELMEGARHEIFSEADAYRNPGLALTVRYFDALGGAE
jgi:lysophospholipase